MAKTDILKRFLFEKWGIRGEWVLLEHSWQTAKQHQNLSHSAQNQLGQALAAVAMLSATIKFQGSLILQIQGDGDIKTIVAQSTDKHKMRGLVRGLQTLKSDSLTKLVGSGRLVLTIEPEKGNPYQGIVPLEKETLAQVLENYFEQSEQLTTRMWLFANETYAGGLLLQQLPNEHKTNLEWERIEILANTVTEQELFNLNCEELLYRLFHEDEIRVFESEPVAFECSCSKLKIERTLIAMGKEEIHSMLEEKKTVEITCEFCGHTYFFDLVDLHKLLTSHFLQPDSHTTH